MKKTWKRMLSLALCAAMLIGVLGVSALAADPAEYTELPYHTYTYIGDSISWGYGLDPNTDNHDPFNVGRRVPGSFTDIIATVLEQNNGAVIHPAASSGSRLCDYRMLLERGMGFENPYERTQDWYGDRHPERTERLRDMGPDVCTWLQESDLVTVQIGINDLTAALVNAASATGLIDLKMITNISDFQSVVNYLNTVLLNLGRDPRVMTNLTRTFYNELSGIRTNACAVVDHVVTLAPENADIILVGYHKAFQGMRVFPYQPFSPIFDLLDSALVSMNDYYMDIAAQYDNVYYVDAPDASVFYPQGTSLLDVVKNIDGFLLGIHPDANGHIYIAGRVLDELKALSSCHHKNTYHECETVRVGFRSEYVSKEICSDCGKVVSTARLETPIGSIHLPVLTLQNKIDTIHQNIYSTVTQIFQGVKFPQP